MGWSVAKLDRGKSSGKYIAEVTQDVKRMRAESDSLDVRAYLSPESEDDPARIYFSPDLSAYAIAFNAESCSPPSTSGLRNLF